MMSDINVRHKQKMQKQKERVDARIKEATTERGVFVFLTGNGKGKSSSAFGMVLRALGYGQKVGVIQFIKGNRTTGESLVSQQTAPGCGSLPDGDRVYLGQSGS